MFTCTSVELTRETHVWLGETLKTLGQAPTMRTLSDDAATTVDEPNFAKNEALEFALTSLTERFEGPCQILNVL